MTRKPRISVRVPTELRAFFKDLTRPGRTFSVEVVEALQFYKDFRVMANPRWPDLVWCASNTPSGSPVAVGQCAGIFMCTGLSEHIEHLKRKTAKKGGGR